MTGERTNCYVCLARNGDPSSVSISCELHYKVVQVDPATGEVRRGEEKRGGDRRRRGKEERKGEEKRRY